MSRDLSSDIALAPAAVLVRRASAKPSLGILIAVAALGPMALNIFIPAMPSVAAVFATDYGTIQLTLTLYLVGVAVAQLFMGPLSDRYGRRPVLLAGIGLFLAGSLAAAFAGSIGSLIVARVVQAVGGCAGLVLGRAIVRDTHSPEDSAGMIGYITMAMVAAPMLAPLLGGYLDTWFGWRSTFLASLIAGIVVLAFAWARLHETHHRRHTDDAGADNTGASFTVTGVLRGFSVLLCDRTFLGHTVNVSFTMGVFFAFLGAAPYIMIEVMDRQSNEYGLYFMLCTLSYMAGNFASGRLSSRAAAERLILTGSTCVLVGIGLLAALALTTEMVPLSLFGPVMLVGAASGLSLPSATAAAISARPHLAGTASGLVGFLQMMVGALATWVVGKLQDDTVFPMVAVMSAAAIIAVFGYGLTCLSFTREAATAPAAASD